MLKELFEAHFYGTFPKMEDKVLNLREHILKRRFSLLDHKACLSCHYVCDSNSATREQMRVESNDDIHVISLEEVFSYVKGNMGEICDYLLEGENTVAIVEMTCSTSDFVIEKRQKARRQLYNTLTRLMMSPIVKVHIERIKRHYVVFSWKETFNNSPVGDTVAQSMTGMTIMADEVYSPDNESKFDFDFKLKEIRYPYALVI